MPNNTLIFKLFSTITVLLKKVPNTTDGLQLAKPVTASTSFLKKQLKRLVDIPDYLLNCIKSPSAVIKRLFVKQEQPKSTEISIDLDLSNYFKVDFITYKEASLNIKTDKKILQEE